MMLPYAALALQAAQCPPQTFAKWKPMFLPVARLSKTSLVPTQIIITADIRTTPHTANTMKDVRLYTRTIRSDIICPAIVEIATQKVYQRTKYGISLPSSTNCADPRLPDSKTKSAVVA